MGMRENGELPRGSMAKIAKNLGVAPKRVCRLWVAEKSTRAAGTVQTPDVTIKKGHHEQRMIYSREEVMEQIKGIPLDKRSTVRHAAAELKIPKSTVQRIIK